MKVVTFAMILSLIVFAFSNCKKDKEVDCAALTTTVVNAMQADLLAGTPASCKAYKAAVQELMNSSCMNSMTAEQKADYQDDLNASCD